jgi:2-methylcitrate dehydratase PrpD
MTIKAPLAIRLAEHVVAFREADITPKALAWAKTAIIDTVGVTFAGVPEPCVQILLGTPGIAEAPGDSLIFGTRRRTSPLDATLINGTAAHALDFDDFNGHIGGHASVMLFPPLLALSDGMQVTGRQLVAAFVVGYELMIRMARGVNPRHYDMGWHPTATLGTFAAAAASSHLLNLDVPKTATALALAASMASGIKSNFGTMTKPFHVGHATRNGLLAALLAERGFEANARALEAKQGFLDVFNGPGTYDIDRMFSGWGAPWEIEDVSNGLKQFPCCGSTHPAIFMMLKLREEEGITADAAERIEILAHPRRLPHTDNPDPRSPLQAKFSIQYATARALADGAVRLEHFEGDAYEESRVQRLLKITSAGPHPDMASDSPKHFGAEVRVTLKDGRQVSRRVDHMVGRSPEFPMTSAELFEKFSDCAKRALPKAQIAPLYDRLETLDSVADMRQVTRLIEPLEVGIAGGGGLAPAPGTSPRPGGYETTWVP